MAGGGCLGAVMLGAGPGAEADAQAPPRPPVPASPTPNAPPSAARQLQIAVDLAYNLDHDQAAAVLEQGMRDHPDDAALPRAHATLTWLNLLFKRGMVLVENYLGPASKDDVKVAAPPGAANTSFQTNVARSITLSEAQLKRRPDDPTAMFGRRFSPPLDVGGHRRQGMGAFRAARRAYNLHERDDGGAPARRRRPHRRHLSLPGGQPGAPGPLAGLHGRLRRRQGEGLSLIGGGQLPEPVPARRPLRAGAPLQPGRALRRRPDPAR
jgi:hypothetical protein